LSGKRRKPFHVQKTVSYTVDVESKKVIQERVTIGYYATRQEALQALADYNANPYDINASKITFSEVYDKWSERKFKEVSKSNINGYKAACNVCGILYDMRFVDIKLAHLQEVADTSGKNYPTLRKLKVLFGQLFDYAVMNEIITKDRHIVEYLNIKDAGNPNKYDRTPFSAAEIALLWKNVGTNEYLQIVLMLIYSGVRISEMLDLKKSDVHLEERWFYVRDSKTDAGIRAVPIADKTYNFFKAWYNKNDCEYLLSTPDGEHFLYRNYYDSYWINPLTDLGIDHKPHDTRHTCVSLLASAKVDPTTIKKIVGHRGAQTLTERVYTHLDISVLLDAINLI
jgi:integrase